MALSATERNVFIGSGIAAILPVAVARSGLDDAVDNLANDVFEGDLTRARQIAAMFYLLAGLGLAYLVIEELSGEEGVIVAGTATALVAIAVTTYVNAGSA